MSRIKEKTYTRLEETLDVYNESLGTVATRLAKEGDIFAVHMIVSMMKKNSSDVRKIRAIFGNNIDQPIQSEFAA